ncbi:MAG: glycosyltransferase [Chloroflexota bacterium]|nr:glycosyltransferase [Chloroflexota bacterium]
MHRLEYPGPAVFGYDTDAPLRRVASISVHTSPLAVLGGKDAGGMNVYVRELARHLAQRDLPVDIFTRRTDPTTPETVEIDPGVNLISIPAGPPEPLDKRLIFPFLAEFAAQAALYSLRQGVRYDVAHSHYWLSGWAAHLLRRFWDTPFVHMFHTTAHMKNAVAGVADLEPQIRVDHERRLVELADSLIAANPDERADLVWRQRADASKICTVPPGVDLALFKPMPQEEARAALGINSDECVIAFVGRIDPIKGVEVLFDALRMLNEERFRRPRLLFVGGDLDEAGEPTGALAEVAALADQINLRDRVLFAGSRPRERLPFYYCAADVVAVPSRYESFGLVAVEAMACGTPVVASRVGGLKFTVEEGVSGLLVPPGDPVLLANGLASVLRNPELRTRLGAAALNSARPFAWPAVALAIHHIYQRLADGHRANLCCDEEIYA